MLNMGFIEQVEAIIKKLPTRTNDNVIFSYSTRGVKNLSLKYMKTPIDIEINATGLTTDKIDHSLYEVAEKDKFSLLKDVTIVENPDSCIIFCRTKDRVDTGV